MKKRSAGILLYKMAGHGAEVLLVHPGGPFWAKKDAGVWSIPKGEFEANEEPIAAAKREFTEELGSPVPAGELLPLGTAHQASGKTIYAWALQADLDVTYVHSNVFTMEWPPKSGTQQVFPEVDRAQWFPLASAAHKLNKGQLHLLERLAAHVGTPVAPSPTSTPQTTIS